MKTDADRFDSGFSADAGDVFALSATPGPKVKLIFAKLRRRVGSRGNRHSKLFNFTRRIPFWYRR